MPAIDLLTRPDLNTAFSGLPVGANLPTPAGLATPGTPFGDVLSNSIDSSSAFGPLPENSQSGSAPAGNAQFCGTQFGGTQFASAQFRNNAFDGARSGTNPSGFAQSGFAQSGKTPSGISQSGNSFTGSSHASEIPEKARESSSSRSQSDSVSPSNGNADAPGDAPKSAPQNADTGAHSQAGNGAPTDQPSLLSASAAGANQAATGQSSPNSSNGASTAKGDKPAPDVAARAGAAPAQLVNNLLQADIANANSPSATTTGVTQAAPRQAGDNPDNPDAPQALIAGLAQAVSQTGAEANRVPAIQPTVGTPAGDTTRNSGPAAGKGAASPAAQQAPTATDSAAVTANAGNLVSLIQTSATASTAETASNVSSDAISSDGKSTGKKQTGNALNTRAGASQETTAPQIALPATGDASGNTQVSQQSDSNAAPVVAGSQPSGDQPIANQQPGSPQSGTVTLFGSSFVGTATAQSASFAAAPADSLPLAAQMLTSVLPASSASSTTSVLDAGNTAQLTNPNDAHQVVQTPGSQDPGYLLFGAAPPSLQLQVANIPTAHAASSGSLSSFVLDQAAYAIQYSHANGQQMQLHLNPPELGALQVDVSMRDGVLSARIEAQTLTAQQILTDNISQLKDSLTQQGVSFDRIDVHLAGSNTGSGGAGSADKSFAQQQDGGHPWDQQFAQPESEDSVPRAPAPSIRTSRTPLTSLDIMA